MSIQQGDYDQYTPNNVEHLSLLAGVLNKNISMIERALGLTCEVGMSGIELRGDPTQIHHAKKVLEALERGLAEGQGADDQRVLYVLNAELAGNAAGQDQVEFTPGFVAITAKGRSVVSKTLGQKTYLDAIAAHDLCFAIGPAGTGKTYLAVAMAVQAFRRKEVSRIILTRPAVEAGEKLGYLPGDLQSKVDPYMRPLYDALNDFMGIEQAKLNQEKGVIEVSPLAYMRGRTLDDAFIILDEAQNTTPEQMKMFLTRIGYNSKTVVTGDDTQVDLPHGVKSGLREVERILAHVEGIHFVYLGVEDIVRNPLVQRIIEAYDRDEELKGKIREAWKRESTKKPSRGMAGGPIQEDEKSDHESLGPGDRLAKPGGGGSAWNPGSRPSWGGRTKGDLRGPGKTAPGSWSKHRSQKGSRHER